MYLITTYHNQRTQPIVKHYQLLQGKAMISPQELGIGSMTMEEYARVMPGESYWRERISKEIEAEIVKECSNESCRCDVRNAGLQVALDIARGYISSNNKDISGDLIEAKNRIQKSRKWNG